MTTEEKGLMPARFEQGPPMRLAGLRQRYTYDNMGEIPQLWQRFIPLADAAELNSELSYGLIFGDHANRAFDYMCAIPVEGSAPLPEGMVECEVPAHKYAVFIHPGSTATLPDSIDQIFQTWLPNSNMELALNPDFFERYGPGFDPETMSGDLELWVPVK